MEVILNRAVRGGQNAEVGPSYYAWASGVVVHLVSQPEKTTLFVCFDRQEQAYGLAEWIQAENFRWPAWQILTKLVEKFEIPGLGKCIGQSLSLQDEQQVLSKQMNLLLSEQEAMEDVQLLEMSCHL